MLNDLISRQAAIDALWKALYEYEDVTEKQFIESEELDVGDWFQHRIFVQNMSDIDRQTILALPSAQPEIIRCKDCKYQCKGQNECETWNLCGYRPWQYTPTTDEHFCSYAERREENKEDA